MDGILLAVLALSGLAAFQLGRRRALGLAEGRERGLHSRSAYHGAYVAMWCALPALAVLLAWGLLEGSALDWLVIRGLPAEVTALSAPEFTLFMSDVRSLAAGGLASRDDPTVALAAQRYADFESPLSPRRSV